MDWIGAVGNSEYAVYAILVGSFIAAVCNAAFANGGAMIVLGVTSAVLPIGAIVPIHSTLLIGSTASRAVVFREHIRDGKLLIDRISERVFRLAFRLFVTLAALRLMYTNIF